MPSQRQPLELRFSSQVYSLETIKKAAYSFTNRLAFHFSIEKDDIICQITNMTDGSQSDVDKAINEFKNEILDQDLRSTIASETKSVRNVILGHVFSKTGLQAIE